jgi:cytochrome c5
VPAAPGAELKLSGQDVYNKVCMACHATGAVGAPKVGAKDQWESRVAQGLDTLVNHAVNGIRAMPPKGGNPALTEANIRDSIIYMLDETGIKTDAGAAPAAAPTAPAAAAPVEAVPAEAAPAEKTFSATFDSYVETAGKESAPAAAPTPMN